MRHSSVPGKKEFATRLPWAMPGISYRRRCLGVLVVVLWRGGRMCLLYVCVRVCVGGTGFRVGNHSACTS